MKKYIFLSILFLLTLVSAQESNAVVEVVDMNENSESEESPQSFFTQGTIETGGTTGDTQAGDYVIIACTTTVDVSNSFNSPTPDGWTLLDAGQCDGNRCISAIWGKFTNDPDPEIITCDWNEPRAVFVAGSFRYRDVDTSNPIIDIACSSGSGETALAPSIIVEPGGQLAAIVAFNLDQNILPPPEESPITFAEFDAFAQAFICSTAIDQNIGISGVTGPVASGGPTGEGMFDIGMPAVWRACTLALRMQTRNVPTLSEWGLIAMAALLGIVGFMVIRRRKVTA